MLLYACSSNHGKLKEFTFAADKSGVEELQILPLPELKVVEPPDETGATFGDNASLKALYYSQFTPELVFADDSGLEVEALGNEPGVYSARYAGPSANDADNIELLLRRLKGNPNRRARFVCVIALAKAGKLLTMTDGAVQGEILDAPRGTNGFGYDPVFLYPPLQKSFGEIDAPTKLSVSHRGNALRKFFAALKTGVGL